MTVSKVYKLHGVTTGDNFYSQLESGSLNTNVTDMTVTPAGHTIPMFTAQNGSKPEVQLQTHQIESLLDEMGFLGADVSVVVLRLRKVANKGSRVANATTEHITYTCNSVLGYITQITAGANKQAAASAVLKLLNDGSNAAYIYSGAAASSGSPSAAENFVLGKIGHNGTAITGCDAMTLDLGVELVEPAQEDLNEPTFCAVNAIKPTLTFDTTDATVWSLHGTKVTGGLKVNLIKKKPDLDRYADSDTEHIVLTITNGRIECESVGGADSLVKVKVFAVSVDGTTAPVIATTGSAVDIAAIT